MARYQRHLSPPTSPSPWRPSQASDLTCYLPSNAHLRTPFPRTDSETRREELAKQFARDDEPVSVSPSGGGDANYLLAKAVVGRYAESYLPGIKEHKVVLERGVGVVGESLRQRKRGGSGSRGARRGKDGLDSMVSPLVRGVEVEWMIWSRLAPPVVALYAWSVVFAIWRELDDGERDFLAQITTNRGRVKTWLTWASAGLPVLLCVLALVVWAAAEVIRMFPASKPDLPPGKGDESI